MQPAIAGATGYAGLELARLLTRHPRTKAPVFFARTDDSAGARLSAVYPHLTATHPSFDGAIEPLDFARMKRLGVDVLFLATPHEQSREWAPEALASGIRVIDLSGAWRLRHPANRAVYHFDEDDSEASTPVQEKARYGLPELHRDTLAGAELVANPGCYATSIILALAPLLRAGLVKPESTIICDSKSGVSGAGKRPTPTTHFMSASENLSAYALYAHRHLGELVEQLGVDREQITFTPHLLPVQRGILSTIYVTLAQKTDNAAIQHLYEAFFASSPMLRIFRPPALPEIQHSVHTNFCDIGFTVAPEGRRLTVISCLDNLLKGAAGQAVQNMNLMFQFDEAEGLR